MVSGCFEGSSSKVDIHEGCLASERRITGIDKVKEELVSPIVVDAWEIQLLSTSFQHNVDKGSASCLTVTEVDEMPFLNTSLMLDGFWDVSWATGIHVGIAVSCEFVDISLMSHYIQ
jgi:hypothetical protein